MDARQLIEELKRERDGFFAVLSGVAPESWTTPGLVGEWSAREIIAHLGYCAGLATEAIHAAEQGRVDQDEPDVEAENAIVARIARGTGLPTVRRREAASVDALVERLSVVEPALLSLRLPTGRTLADTVRGDAGAHYREHAEALRSTLDEAPRG